MTSQQFLRHGLGVVCSVAFLFAVVLAPTQITTHPFAWGGVVGGALWGLKR